MNEPIDKTDSASRAATWLSDFAAALAARDVAVATVLFQSDCYWRDLVSFTWNIATFEGREAIGAMLAATLGPIAPHRFAIEGEPESREHITEAWFTFETAVARGRGHFRLKGEKCWTLLTTITELKGYEEKAGERREKGVEHGAQRNRRNWLERKAALEASLGQSEQPYCAIIGGGQGGIALGARLKRLGVPTIILDKNPRPATHGGTATGRSFCMTPSGTTTCPTCHSPTIGPSSRQRTS